MAATGKSQLSRPPSATCHWSISVSLSPKEDCPVTISVSAAHACSVNINVSHCPEATANRGESFSQSAAQSCEKNHLEVDSRPSREGSVSLDGGDTTSVGARARHARSEVSSSGGENENASQDVDGSLESFSSQSVKSNAIGARSFCEDLACLGPAALTDSRHTNGSGRKASESGIKDELNEVCQASDDDFSGDEATGENPDCERLISRGPSADSRPPSQRQASFEQRTLSASNKDVTDDRSCVDSINQPSVLCGQSDLSLEQTSTRTATEPDHSREFGAGKVTEVRCSENLCREAGKLQGEAAGLIVCASGGGGEDDHPFEDECGLVLCQSAGDHFPHKPSKSSIESTTRGKDLYATESAAGAADAERSEMLTTSVTEHSDKSSGRRQEELVESATQTDPLPHERHGSELHPEGHKLGVLAVNSQPVGKPVTKEPELQVPAVPPKEPAWTWQRWVPPIEQGKLLEKLLTEAKNKKTFLPSFQKLASNPWSDYLFPLESLEVALTVVEVESLSVKIALLARNRKKKSWRMCRTSIVHLTPLEVKGKSKQEKVAVREERALISALFTEKWWMTRCDARASKQTIILCNKNQSTSQWPLHTVGCKQWLGGSMKKSANLDSVIKAMNESKLYQPISRCTDLNIPDITKVFEDYCVKL